MPVSKGTVNPRWGLKDVLEIRDGVGKDVLTINGKPRCSAGGSVQSGLTNTGVPAFLFHF